MANYIVKEGKWEDFFDFKLPDLIYSRVKSGSLSHSMNFHPDKEFNFPTAILEIGVYNPMAYKNQKVFKAKLWFDKDGRSIQLNPEDYFKYSEYSREVDDILYEIGEEIKVTTLKNRTTIIKTKDPSDYSYDSTFNYFKNKVELCLPSITNSLSEHLKEQQVKINDYITLELRETSFRVSCKGLYFWTFIREDVRRPRPVEPEKPYEEWFKNEYLPGSNDEFQPQKLEFSEVCELFYQWNDNNLKNIDFNWHFYGHLMSRLQDAGHPEAKDIYIIEIKKREEMYSNFLSKKRARQYTQKGMWNEFFDFGISSKKLQALEFQTSSWIEFPTDAEKMIPRSILEITIYKAEFPNEKWIDLNWYLERSDEMREIAHEKSTYYKYGEFLAKKDKILRNLGEEFHLGAYLDGLTYITFNNPAFVPKEIIFPELKKKVKQVLKNIKGRSKSYKVKKEVVQVLSENDKKVLLFLEKKLNREFINTKDIYTSGKDPCYSAKGKYITGIRIFSLLEDFPEIICKLKNLEGLDLSHNDITKIPNSIGQLKRLKKLSLSHNKLKTLPENMGNLKKLTKLYLSNNKIRSYPEAINNIKSLKTLFLENNQLLIIPESIEKLKNLKHLYIYRNKIKELPENIKSLKNLKTLSIFFNQIESIPTQIDQLEFLKVLNLEINKLKIIPNSLGNLKSLEFLNLEFNEIENIPDSILRLPKLRKLSVSPKFLDDQSNKTLKILAERRVDIIKPPHNRKFFFEYGGCMFWGNGGENGEHLPLSSNTVKELKKLSNQWEDQYYPGSKEKRWSRAEQDEFKRRTSEILKVVESELGEDFNLEY